MEVNKEEAARCRDIGAAALRNGQHARAVKFFAKSLRLYPLPGVKVLLGQAERKLAAEEGGGGGGGSTANGGTNGGFNTNSTSHSGANGFAARSSSSAASASAASATNATTTTATGADGREYTEAQVSIVNKILKARKGGRGAHYRVLELAPDANDASIKKAYRKLALKLHPDKNSAPHADEAFKAVGLAYATLSDARKRRIYDASGEEDPDNRGGGMRPGNMNFNGQEVSPEDIFNMFFGGGMPGGGGMGPGVRVYSTGFGPGMAFGGMNGMGGMHARARRGQQQQQQRQPETPFAQLVQFLPVLMIMLLSFMNMGGDGTTGATGGSRYFSLTPVSPHTNPLHTRLAKVKDIPYYVTDQFLRTVARDRYQLSQVERMVERSYERYLGEECRNQKAYKRRLEHSSRSRSLSEEDREKVRRKAEAFELGRCLELEDLFPASVPARERVGPRSEF